MTTVMTIKGGAVRSLSTIGGYSYLWNIMLEDLHFHMVIEEAYYSGDRSGEPSMITKLTKAATYENLNHRIDLYGKDPRKNPPYSCSAQQLARSILYVYAKLGDLFSLPLIAYYALSPLLLLLSIPKYEAIYFYVETLCRPGTLIINGFCFMRSSIFRERSCGFSKDRREFFAKLGGVGKKLTIFILNLAPSQDTNDQNGKHCSITEVGIQHLEEMNSILLELDLDGDITTILHGGGAHVTRDGRCRNLLLSYVEENFSIRPPDFNYKLLLRGLTWTNPLVGKKFLLTRQKLGFLLNEASLVCSWIGLSGNPYCGNRPCHSSPSMPVDKYTRAGMLFYHVCGLLG
ncbi:unnamed protein product [Withania somnifera]